MNTYAKPGGGGIPVRGYGPGTSLTEQTGSIPDTESDSSPVSAPKLCFPKSIFAILDLQGTGLYPNPGNGTGGHMSVLPNAGNGKITVPELLARKTSTENSKKIVCLTAYDYPTARLLDEAGVDVILV